MSSHKHFLKQKPVIFYAALVLILAGCYFFIPSFQQQINIAVDVLTGEDEERIQKWVSTFGVFGPIVIIAGMMLQMFLFIVPNILLMMIAIVSYGPFWGGVISFVGVFASSSLGYFVGSKLSKVTLSKFVSMKNQQKIGDFIQQYGVGAIITTRLSSFSNDGLSIVAGVLKMEFKKYIISTLLGITPLIVLLAIFGKNEKIEWALLWVTLASLGMLIFYIILDKRRKRKRQSQHVNRTNLKPSPGLSRKPASKPVKVPRD
jgi:uncharacterized membrane protein YdjX (TVP38/TMEM64 family)